MPTSYQHAAVRNQSAGDSLVLAALPPTITNPGDAELLVNATNGSRILFTNGFPAVRPSQTYALGVQTPAR